MKYSLFVDPQMLAVFSQGAFKPAVLLSPEMSITDSDPHCLCFQFSVAKPLLESIDDISLNLAINKPNATPQALVDFSEFSCGPLVTGNKYRVELRAHVSANINVSIHKIFLNDSVTCQKGKREFACWK